MGNRFSWVGFYFSLVGNLIHIWVWWDLFSHVLIFIISFICIYIGLLITFVYN